MSINVIVEKLADAVSNTSGDERRMYEALLNYLQTQNSSYKSEAQKYYRRCDYSAQSRADAVVDILSQYGS